MTPATVKSHRDGILNSIRTQFHFESRRDAISFWGGNLRIATANAVRYNKSANSEIGSPRTADFVGSAKQGDWQPKRARTPNRIHIHWGGNLRIATKSICQARRLAAQAESTSSPL